MNQKRLKSELSKLLKKQKKIHQEISGLEEIYPEFKILVSLQGPYNPDGNDVFELSDKKRLAYKQHQKLIELKKELEIEIEALEREIAYLKKSA